MQTALKDSPAAIKLPDNAIAKRQTMATEARQLQVLVLNDAKDEKLKPFIRAQLARAYRELGEFRLRLQGKGPPKAVDYQDRKRKPSPISASFTETPAQAKPKRTPKQVATPEPDKPVE